MSFKFPYLQDYIKSMPFSIEVARSLADQAGACVIRSEAYARHGYPEALVERLRKVDLLDGQARILVAKDNATGEVIGTINVFCSLDGVPPIAAEFNTKEVAGQSHIYLNRFGVKSGPHAAAVTAALVKSAFKLAAKDKIQWILASALPAQERIYRSFGLRVLEGNEEGYHIPSVHPGRYRGLGQRVNALIQMVHESANPFREFILIKHKEIKI